jgi:signal transduction histidine kinase
MMSTSDRGISDRSVSSQEFSRLIPFQSNKPVRLEDILITNRLRVRHRAPNLRDEARALRILAREMATAPDRLIDTLLNLAIELCHADTAGLRIFDENSQTFVWTNLAGTLQQHAGNTATTNFSSRSVGHDGESPQLYPYPGRYFKHLADRASIPFVGALMVPVYIRGEAPATMWILSRDKAVAFDTEDVRILSNLVDFTIDALQVVRSAESAKQYRERAEAEIEGHRKTEQALRETHNTMQVLLDGRTAQLHQLTSTLMTLQDEERRRIARELHDSAGQDLAAIEMNLHFLTQEGSPRTASELSYLADALEAVRHCTSEIRTLSYLLHPPLLDEFGLFSALTHFVGGFSRRSGIRIEMDIPRDLGRFDTKIEIAIFRVVQQSLANIHRHSGAFTAEMKIAADAEHISVQVRDEGRGIPPEVITRINSSNQIVGIGIAGMRERINGLGGCFHVRSGKDGTVVEVSLPVA